MIILWFQFNHIGEHGSNRFEIERYTEGKDFVVRARDIPDSNFCNVMHTNGSNEKK